MTPLIPNCRNHRRTTRKVLGDRAEARALKHLQKNGLTLVQRNFRCRFGEIDLIMRDPGCLVFVEVRCRSSTTFARPALTVDPGKQMRIRRAASAWLASRPGLADEPVRFDVIAIESATFGRVTIQWIRDAFRC